MKIAAVQVSASLDIDENLPKAVGFIREAKSKGAKFVALPEYFACYGNIRTMRKAAKESNQIISKISESARELKIFILAGGVVRPDKSSKKLVNESLLFNPKGNVVATYRKKNLFTATINGKRYGEGSWLTAGKRYTLFDINEWSVGFSTCYDIRFPLHFQKLRKMGANLIVAPSAFTFETGKAHWMTLITARAIETQSYVLAPALTGESEGLNCWGETMIVDPWGKVLISVNNGEGIIISEISKKTIKDIRRDMPL